MCTKLGQFIFHSWEYLKCWLFVQCICAPVKTSSRESLELFRQINLRGILWGAGGGGAIIGYCCMFVPKFLRINLGEQGGYPIPSPIPLCDVCFNENEAKLFLVGRYYWGNMFHILLRYFNIFVDIVFREYWKEMLLKVNVLEKYLTAEFNIMELYQTAQLKLIFKLLF
jgi:hypothetical protein